MAQRLRLAADLQTRAAFAPDTFDPAKGTVEVTWTTGARGKRNSFWDGPYYEELEVSEKAVDLSRLNNGASLLNAHGAYELGDVIGVVERAWLSGSEGRALVRFSEREDVKPIRADVEAGILRHISVGYSVQRMEKVEEIDGVPVYRATRWTPAEISLVPIAFDDGAVVRAADKQPQPYEVEIIDLTPRSQEPHMTTQTIPDGGSSTPAASAAAASVAAPPAPSGEAATRAERDRVTGIMQVVGRAKLPGELATRLIAEGVTLDAARAAVLDELAARDAAIPTTQHVRAEAGEDSREKFLRGATAAIMARAGVTEIVRAGQKVERVAEQLRDVAFDAGEFRGMRLLDLARASLERRGISTKGLHGEQLVRSALQTRDAGMNTTSDFAILLETAMYKVLLAAYATTPDTWRRFCAVKSVADFRTATFYRNGTFGALDSLTEAGEFKHKNIPDGEKATIVASTKGNIIGLTRKAIVNDDLGAFNDLATRLGRAAALSIELDVYALLKLNSGLGPTQSDSQPLFHANRSNIGTSGAMSVTTLDGSRAIMAAQKDPSGNEILDLRPAIWLGPVGLGGQARVFNQAQYEPTANKLMVPNVVAGIFRDVVDTAQLTGTRHYLLADPNVAPVFAVAFIDGQQTPELVSEQSFEFDGVQWRVREDYGVAVLDYRGAVTCPGA